MRAASALREPVQSLSLPPHVPPIVIMGQRGKIMQKMQQLTGARLAYVEQDHRVDIRGRLKDCETAARLLERTVEHYQYSGMQFSRKLVYNVLSPELTDAEELHLLPCSRPVASALPGGVPSEGFVLSPVSSSPGPYPSASFGRQQPGASTSGSGDIGAGGGGADAVGRPGGRPPPQPLLRPAADLDIYLQQLIDLAATASLQHPTECSSTEIRLYLGKLLCCDLSSSHRLLLPASLLEWTYPRNARTQFDTALPQDTIRSLDKYLTSRGLVATQQVKSASLHLETSIPWIQYHPTFTVGEGGELRMAKLETLGCKPLTIALTGPSDRTDVRMRYVASVQHSADDEVAQELRYRESQFALVNGTQVVIPSDLRSFDLTLTSARVKLKRVYASPQPLPPPPPPADRRSRAKRSAAEAEAEAGTLPAVGLKVSAAGVVDNLGGKRLEVTVSCPELNAALMALHRSREEPVGAREGLMAQLRSLLAHVEDMRANVEFTP